MAACKDRIAQFIDWIFKGSNMAGELESVKVSLEVLKLAAAGLSAKQDLVVAKVQELKDIIAAGGSVDPADVAAVLASVAEVQASVDAASVKADSVLV